MVSRRRIWAVIFAEPFRPFRLQTTDGRSFVVRDEHSIMIGATYLEFVWWPEDDPDGPDHQEKIPLAEIESIAAVEIGVPTK